MDQQYKCGHCGFFINSQCEDYTSHECFKHMDINLHDLVADDNGILTLSIKGTNIPVQVTQEVSQSWEEMLVKYVQDRPPLYNISLPVSERTNLKKNNLWAEIYNLLEGKHTLEDIKAKWRYLRDCYMKAKKKMSQYKPSGSAAGTTIDPGFRYYASMKFLDNSLERPATIGSIPLKPPLFSPTPSTSSSDLGIGSNRGSDVEPGYNESHRDTPSTKRRKQDDTKDFRKGVLEMLAAPPKESDGVEGFLIRLGESLRRFPRRERSRLEIDILKLVYDREMELDL